jgi:hypothetical protein
VSDPCREVVLGVGVDSCGVRTCSTEVDNQHLCESQGLDFPLRDRFDEEALYEEQLAPEEQMLPPEEYESLPVTDGMESMQTR